MTAQLSTEELSGENAYVLSCRADTYSPDSPESDGARYLERVRDALLEAVRYQAEQGDTFDPDGVHEIADGCVPIYTYDVWKIFVDLGAYHEDISEYAADSDMEKMASIALYMIAERLCYSVLSDLGIES